MSHGTLSAFFSAVDDASELGFPGLHCTFGGFGDGKKIQIAASVVNRGVRYTIDAHNFFEPIYINTIKPHPLVNGQIDIIIPKPFVKSRYYPILEYDDEDPIVYRHYTTEFTDLINAKRRQQEIDLDSSIDDLTRELFDLLAEAEGLGYISSEKCTEYIEEFDSKFTELLKDTIPEIEKIAIMESYCSETVKEITESVKRYETQNL
jgi:hypothetical protein